MTVHDDPGDGRVLLRCTAHGTPIRWVTPPLPPEGVRIACIPACSDAARVEIDRLRAELDVAQDAISAGEASIAWWRERCTAIEARLAQLTDKEEQSK